MHRLVTTLILGIAAVPALADTYAGVADLSIDAPHHGRPMQAAIWYPAQQTGTPAPYAENAVFHGTNVLRDADMAKGQYPVVLLSHGLGGNQAALQWLAAGLATRGALVLTVNHPNSSTWDFDMEQGLDHGTRPQDMSLALDWLQGSEFAPRTDGRTMAAGFSFGGWTALSLGGVRGNLAGYIAHCDTAKGRSSHCNDIARAGIDLGTLDADLWNADYQDPRITTVAAIDPGLHCGLEPDDLAGYDLPTLLIGLGDGADRLYATDTKASGFAALLPDTDIQWLAPAAHFSMLPICKPAGAAILKEENDDPVCTDPAGTDRAALHDQVIDLLAGHLGL